MDKYKNKTKGINLTKTIIGTIGISWSEHGINNIQLPEATETDTLKCLKKQQNINKCEPVPKWLKHSISTIEEHLNGNLNDLLEIKIDINHCSLFYTKVYNALRKITPGKTVSYGDLAKLAGSPKAARAVGRAVASNPIPLIIPCHRVLASGNKPGGFSAFGGIETKKKLLKIEGVELY